MKLKAIFLAGLVCASVSVTAQEDLSQMNEDQLVAAAEKLIAKDAQKQDVQKTIKAESKDQPLTQREIKESKIPAFRAKEKAVASSTSPWARLIFGGGVILILALGLLIAAKRFGKKRNSQDSKVHLDVISQRALSPKQSLMVVRVAGEHLLIGATDHSINLIKSISLIDDESTDSLPQDFNNFLEDEFVEQRTFTL